MRKEGEWREPLIYSEKGLKSSDSIISGHVLGSNVSKDVKGGGGNPSCSLEIDSNRAKRILTC